jgi:hypothetical protein
MPTTASPYGSFINRRAYNAPARPLLLCTDGVMHRFDISTRNHADHYLIIEPRPAGPSIGFFAGAPIAESVIDFFGHRFFYAGLAPRRCDGSYDTDGVGAGEFIAEPGLLYCLERGKSGDEKRLTDGASDTRAARTAAVEEQRQVVRQISLTIMLWLTSAFAVQLLLSAFRAG